MKREPLYLQVADHLRQSILEERSPGDLLPSERELAESFEVSLITVREAMRLLADQGYVSRQPGKGTFVLPGARKQRDERHVAVLWKLMNTPMGFANDGSNHLGYFLRGLREAGVPYRLYHNCELPGEYAVDREFEGFWEAVERNEVSTVLALSGDFSRSWVKRLQRFGISSVGHGVFLSHAVRIDHQAGIRLITRELLKQGSRRPAFLQYKANPSPFYQNSTLREEAFREVLAKHNVPICEEWMVQKHDPSAPHFDAERIIDELWSGPGDPPDGLVMTRSDFYPFLCQALVRRGIRVPGDVRLAVHGSLPVDWPSPLPAVGWRCKQPGRKEQTLQRIISLGQGRKVKAGVISLKPELFRIPGYLEGLSLSPESPVPPPTTSPAPVGSR